MQELKRVDHGALTVGCLELRLLLLSHRGRECTHSAHSTTTTTTTKALIVLGILTYLLIINKQKERKKHLARHSEQGAAPATRTRTQVEPELHQGRALRSDPDQNSHALVTC